MQSRVYLNRKKSEIIAGDVKKHHASQNHNNPLVSEGDIIQEKKIYRSVWKKSGI